MTKLDDLLKIPRDTINSIDTQLLKLLNQRAQCSLEIGNIKHQHGQAVLDSQREQRIIDSLCQQNTGPLKDPQVEQVFRLIFAASRQLQQDIPHE